MDKKYDLKDEVIARAERVLYYNNLLIEQCDSWLSAEEGNRNMEKRIMERRKKEKKAAKKKVSKLNLDMEN
jgi:hypothetical protein